MSQADLGPFNTINDGDIVVVRLRRGISRSPGWETVYEGPVTLLIEELPPHKPTRRGPGHKWIRVEGLPEELGWAEYTTDHDWGPSTPNMLVAEDYLLELINSDADTERQQRQTQQVEQMQQFVQDNLGPTTFE